MSHWNDFNNAENQNSFDVIPAKTPVKVRMTIKPGGFDNPHLGWTGGYVTRNSTTGAAYLNCEFVVLEGPYARRKVWSLIGLHSEKGPEWANMGRSFIRALLNSARGIHPKDDSPAAQSARCIQSFADLDGIEFAARIDVERDQRSGEDRNVIRTVLQPDHSEYAALMGAGGFRAATPASAAPAAPAAPATFGGPAAPAPAAGPAKPFRPAWAE